MVQKMQSFHMKFTHYCSLVPAIGFALLAGFIIFDTFYIRNPITMPEISSQEFKQMVKEGQIDTVYCLGNSPYWAFTLPNENNTWRRVAKNDDSNSVLFFPGVIIRSRGWVEYLLFHTKLPAMLFLLALAMQLPKSLKQEPIKCE